MLMTSPEMPLDGRLPARLPELRTKYDSATNGRHQVIGPVDEEQEETEVIEVSPEAGAEINAARRSATEIIQRNGIRERLGLMNLTDPQQNTAAQLVAVFFMERALGYKLDKLEEKMDKDKKRTALGRFIRNPTGKDNFEQLLVTSEALAAIAEMSMIVRLRYPKMAEPIKVQIDGLVDMVIDETGKFINPPVPINEQTMKLWKQRYLTG
jgi:hypothetical protein